MLRHVAKYILKELCGGGLPWRFVYLMWRNMVKVSERVMWRRLIVEDFWLSRHVDKYTLKELCGGRFLSWMHVEVVCCGVMWIWL